MTPCLVYSTAGSEDEARRLGSMLVEKKFAACVNIVPGMTSVYEWNGAIETGQEWILLVKTSEEKYEAVQGLIVKEHSYDNPCILQIPIKKGAAPFLEWIAASLNI